jgi:hypothetical protein
MPSYCPKYNGGAADLQISESLMLTFMVSHIPQQKTLGDMGHPFRGPSYCPKYNRVNPDRRIPRDWENNLTPCIQMEGLLVR